MLPPVARVGIEQLKGQAMLGCSRWVFGF